jgi:hypothetical protein
LPRLNEVAPEDDRVTVVAVRAGRKQLAWLHNRRARASRVARAMLSSRSTSAGLTPGAPLVTRATTGDGGRCTSTCHASRNTMGSSQRTP